MQSDDGGIKKSVLSMKMYQYNGVSCSTVHKYCMKLMILNILSTKP